MRNRPVLRLPDVAELVRQQIVGGVVVADEDRPPERVAVIAAHLRDAERERRNPYTDALERDGTRIPIEPVETRLRSLEPLAFP